MPRTFTVYILASLTRRLYVGVTGDLISRLHQHRNAQLPSFTARYRITRLVYFEQTMNARAAIQRETEIRQWSRQKKIQLIESTNAGWLDLACDWFESPAKQKTLSLRGSTPPTTTVGELREPAE
jgi:putative endonuclease